MSFYNKSSTVVKLAVIGDVIPDAIIPQGFMSFGMHGNDSIYAPGDEPVEILEVPSDQIASFEYTLFGEDSYKFNIELVNYSENLLTSILKVIAKGIPTVDPDGYLELGGESKLESLPKLLIQWGYEDLDGNPALSTIHSAAITTVDYKFSQGKEKILVLQAVFTGDALDASATHESTLYVDLDMPMQAKADETLQIFINKSGAEKNTQDHLSLGDIVRNAVTDLLETLDGFSVSSSGITDELHMKEVSQLQEALIPRMQIEVDEEGEPLKESDATADEFEKMNSVGFHSRNLDIVSVGKTDKVHIREGSLDSFINRALKDDDMEAHYWKTLESIFSFIGLELTRREYSDIRDELVSRAVSETSAKVDGRLPGAIYAEESKEDPTSETSARVSNDTPVAETTIVADKEAKLYSFVIDQSCEVVLRNLIVENFFDVSNPQFEWKVKNQSLKSNGEFVQQILSKDITSDSDIIENTQQGPLHFGRVVPACQIRLGDGSYVTQEDYVRSVDGGVQKAIQVNTDVEDARKNERRRKESQRLASINKARETFSEMSISGQRAFVLENIKISVISPGGEAPITTARRIIEQYNTFVTGGWSSQFYSATHLETPELALYIEGATYNDQDFTEVLNEKSKAPKDVRTTLCRLGPKSAISADRKAELETATINSSDIDFPLDQLSNQGHVKLSPDEGSESVTNIINLTYGYNDSIVKFFDFKGDIRWLRNATASVRNTINLTNMHTHLEAAQIRKAYIPIADMLLLDADFMAAMDKIPVGENEPTAPEILQALKLIVSNVDDATFINPPADLKLENLSYVRDYLESRPANEDMVKNFGDTFTKSMSTFNLFLAALLDAESVKLLMDTRTAINNDPNLDPELVRHGGERYVLKTRNIFDVRADNTSSDAHLAALQNFSDNLNMFSEVRIKTLGIPEISRLVDVTHRGVHLTVSDPSETNPKRLHWLTGLYRIKSLSHSISPSEGYSSEFQLIKVTV